MPANTSSNSSSRAFTVYPLRCREIHLKVKGIKSGIGPRRISYLGYSVGPDGWRPDPERIAPLVRMVLPTSKDELRSYLGFITYYVNFVSNLASLAAPLWI